MRRARFLFRRRRVAEEYSCRGERGDGRWLGVGADGLCRRQEGLRPADENVLRRGVLRGRCRGREGPERAVAFGRPARDRPHRPEHRGRVRQRQCPKREVFPCREDGEHRRDRAQLRSGAHGYRHHGHRGGLDGRRRYPPRHRFIRRGRRAPPEGGGARPRRQRIDRFQLRGVCCGHRRPVRRDNVR